MTRGAQPFVEARRVDVLSGRGERNNEKGSRGNGGTYGVSHDDAEYTFESFESFRTRHE